MFAIQYVYLPRINKHLSVFAEGWDSHHLRTESNMTPNQLWIYGKAMCKDDEIMEDLVNCGIDLSGPWPSARSFTKFNDSVNIPYNTISCSQSYKNKNYK